MVEEYFLIWVCLLVPIQLLLILSRKSTIASASSQAKFSSAQKGELILSKGINKKKASLNDSTCLLLATLQCVDLSVSIALFLRPNDLASLSAANSCFRRIMTSDLLWRQLWRFRFTDVMRMYYTLHKEEEEGKEDEDLSLLFSPRMRWCDFYCVFEFAWLNWLAAGHNTSTRCLVGVREALYDITAFLPLHPGSEETLLWAAGCDATTIFQDVGHSIEALGLLKNLEICKPRFSSSSLAPPSPSPPSSSSSSCTLYFNGLLRSQLRRQQVLLLRQAESEYREGVAADASGFHATHLLSLRPVIAHPPRSTVTPSSRPACARIHTGSLRIFLNPLTGEWTVWWSCCGWGAPVADVYSLPSRGRRRRKSSYSLEHFSSCSSSFPATVSKTINFLTDIQRSLAPAEESETALFHGGSRNR